MKTLLSLFSVRKVVSFDNVLFITNSNSRNFFHWFLDVLQKVERIEGVLSKELNHEFLVLLPSNHCANFMYESLSAFDVNVRWLRKNELAIVRNLIVVPDVATTGNYRIDTVVAMRERLRMHFGNIYENSARFSRVYITRKNAEKRRIINEDEILPALLEYDFFVADFDSLSFSEQVSCVINADILISLHGAGLTHMLWMKEYGSILEIRARDDSHNNCYFSLASALGLGYYYALADKTDSTKSTQQANYLIDKDCFLAQVMKMLGPDADTLGGSRS